MSFNDLDFYPFLSILLLLLLGIQCLVRNERAAQLIRKGLLLGASFAVIWSYRPEFCLSTAVVILITYAGALLVERAGTGKMRIAGLFVTVLVLWLGYFKYFNFLCSTFASLTGQALSFSRIAAPIGISFYIFTAVGYLLDVAWEKYPAERNLLNLSLMLAFFPKLLCGPLVRGDEFLPQLRENRRMTTERFTFGIQLFAFGFFKKAVLANHMARFLDSVFFAPSAFSMGTLWLAMLSNMPALYFDFSGYSDMAIGISRIMGIDLRKNFNLPFITTNISDFWSRWHMTLTEWLQSYLFNPLAVRFRRMMAGKPKAFRKKYKLLPECAAAVITFFVSGIWHGVGFNFAIFGLLHGFFYVVQKVFAQARKAKGKATSAGLRPLPMLASFFLINLIQVFFRTDTPGDAVRFYQALFVPHAGVFFPSFWSIMGFVFLIGEIVLAWMRQKKRGETELNAALPSLNLRTVPGLTLFLFFVGLTLALGYFGESYFVYEQF